MPVDYSVRSDLGLVLVTFTGLVRAEENVTALMQYRDSEVYDPLLHVLMDLADCRFPETVFAEMQDMSRRLAPYYRARDPRSHTSIYAPTNVGWGMGRLFRSMINPDAPNPVRAFRDAPSALRFVDLDPGDPLVQGLLRPAVGAGRRHFV